MAKIVYAWELGGGMGHLAVAAPILAKLKELGHNVVALLANLTHADFFLGEAKIRYFPLPRRVRGPLDAIRPVCTYAHLLNNSLLSDIDGLLPMVQSWRWMMDDLQPEMIIFDHCPTGLLATRDAPCKRVVWGTGFTCPPDVSPLPDWRPWLGSDPAKLIDDECRVLSKANRVLRSFGLTPLARLTDLFTHTDAMILTTYPELDHFGNRPDMEYFGVAPQIWGKPPQWPEATGPRVFGYLKESPQLELAVAVLKDTGLPAVIYCPSRATGFRQGPESATLRFATEPIDVGSAGASCDFAVLNGTHTTVAQMLLAGKPVVSVPLLLEQQMTGTKLAELRAGLVVLEATQESLSRAIAKVSTQPGLFTGAREFAEKNGKEDGAETRERTLGRLLKLLSH